MRARASGVAAVFLWSLAYTGVGARAEEVENIVVTATRGERPVDALPVSVSVIPEKQVAETPALSVDDLLRTIPGVNLPFGSTLVQHPTAGAISMRGLGGTRTLVLLDGVPLNDPFFGYVQWNRVPKEAIERIEVVRGGASSLFGSYALGGVINVITRSPREDAIAFEGGYGMHDTYRVNASASKRLLGEHLGLGVNLNYFDTDGYVTTVPEKRGEIDIPSSTRSFNVQAKADYTLDPTLSAYVRTNFYRNDQRLGSPLSRNDQHTWDVATGLRKTLDAGTNVAFDVFYLRNRFSTFNTDLLDPDSRDAEFLSNVHRTPSDDAGGSLVGSHAFDLPMRPFLTGGVDFRLISGEDRDRNVDPQGSQILREIGGGKQRNVGVFLEASLFPLEGLEVTPSARVDFHESYRGKDEKNPGETRRFEDESTTELDPKLAVRYQLLEWLAWRGAVYRAFRAPNLDELYRTFSSQGFAILANPALDPEILVGGDVGFDFLKGPVRGQLNFFQNDVKDLVSTEVLEVSPVFTLGRVNVGKIRSRGVEAIVEIALGERWSLRPSYTYTDLDRRVPDVPLHAVFVDLAYHARNGAAFSARERFVSKRLDDGTQSRRLDSFTVLDLYLSYPLYDHVEIFVLAENVLDEDYVASTFSVDSRGAPRQVFGGARVRF